MTPEIAQLLADVTRLRKVSERYAELFEALPPNSRRKRGRCC
jgi:hypothetical protein